MASAKKQLTVILFSDIQGYTTLMQEDESKASEMLRRFRDVLTEKMALFKGRIIQFYGDGALCTFEIPVDAVRCAMA